MHLNCSTRKKWIPWHFAVIGFYFSAFLSGFGGGRLVPTISSTPTEPSVLLRKAPRCQCSLRTLLPLPEREAPACFQAAGLQNGISVGCRQWSRQAWGLGLLWGAAWLCLRNPSPAALSLLHCRQGSRGKAKNPKKQKKGISPPFPKLKSFFIFIAWTILENYRVLVLKRLLSTTYKHVCVVTITSPGSIF